MACAARHRKRLVVVVPFVAFVVYIVMDQITKPCVYCEPEAERVLRLRAADLPLMNLTTGVVECGAEYTRTPQCCERETGCVTSLLEYFVDWVALNPALGAVAYAGVYTGCAVLLVPASVLTIGAGAAFGSALGLGYGTLVGSIAVFVGACCGSMLAFVLAQSLLHDFVQSLLVKHRISRALDAALRQEGLKVMLLLRLSPLIPYNVLNYIMAGTSTSFRDFSLALLAMAPGTVGYVYIGASLLEAASSNETGEAIRIVTLVVGAVAALVAVAAVSWYAKKQLDKSLAAAEDVSAGAAGACVDAPSGHEGAGGGGSQASAPGLELGARHPLV